MRINKISSVIVSGIIASLGAVLFIWPDWTLNTICWIIGTALIVAAIVGGVFAYIGRENRLYAIGYGSGAVIGFIVGLIFLMSSEFIISIIPIIIGVGLLINGIINIMQAFTIKKAEKNWILDFILAVLTVAFGVIIFANPFSTMEVLIKAIGIMLIYNGITNIIILRIVRAFFGEEIRRYESEF